MTHTDALSVELYPGAVVDVLDVDPKGEAGSKKVPLDLVPSSAEIAIATGLSEGASKYGAWNWRKTRVEAMTYVAACRRHLMAYVEGEWADQDSAVGKTHLDGAIASLAILIDAIQTGTIVDNRPPRCDQTLKELSK